jgi:opacity protein-like surface antigen
MKAPWLFVRVAYFAFLFFSYSLASNAEETFYVGISGSKNEVDFGSAVTTTGSAQVEDQDTGYKAFLGYQLHKLISVEAQYADFGDVSLALPNGASTTIGGTTTTNSSGATVTTNVEAESFGFAVLLTVPLEIVRPYLKFGLHSWDTKRTVPSSGANLFATEGSGTDGYRGLGVSMPVLEALSIQVEYEVYDFGDDKMSMASAGLSYRF